MPLKNWQDEIKFVETHMTKFCLKYTFIAEKLSEFEYVKLEMWVHIRKQTGLFSSFTKFDIMSRLYFNLMPLQQEHTTKIAHNAAQYSW